MVGLEILRRCRNISESLCPLHAGSIAVRERTCVAYTNTVQENTVGL